MDKRQSLRHRVFVVGFFASWAAATAVLSFVLCAAVWHVFSFGRFVDDDITFLALPLGLAFGIFAATRTRRSRRLQNVFVIAGPLFSVFGAVAASRYFEKAEQLKGVLGPFSGLGEALAGYFFLYVVTVFGLLVLGIGLFGRLTD